jgi:hypothetical protein
MTWSTPPAMNRRRSLVVLEVHPRVLAAGLEVGQEAVPDEPARRRDVVALVDLVGLLLAEGVGERVVELLARERHRAVAVGRVLERGERRLDLLERDLADALGRRGVDRHARSPEAAVEQHLRQQTAVRVAHQDRRSVELADHRLEVREVSGTRRFAIGAGSRVAYALALDSVAPVVAAAA